MKFLTNVVYFFLLDWPFPGISDELLQIVERDTHI